MARDLGLFAKYGLTVDAAEAQVLPLLAHRQQNALVIG